MSETCSPRKILALRAEGVPIVDVRSPGEFSRAHLLGAYSLPLFSDEERAAVGTLYAQEGRDAAVELGLEYVGGKMRSLVQEAKKLAGESGRIGVYCARGGMRSEAVAWLLSIAGLSVYRMEGGYRAYHQEMMQEPLQYALIILGGATGCGSRPAFGRGCNLRPLLSILPQERLVWNASLPSMECWARRLCCTLLG